VYLDHALLRAEQAYRRQRLRSHDRHLHGWGVVCGLGVVPASSPLRPWAVRICPGYGIDPCGNEILLAGSLTLDIREHVWASPGFPTIAYVAVRHAEDEARPVPARAAGCSCPCQDADYVASRIADAVAPLVVWPPAPRDDARFDLCSGRTPRCPPAPATTSLILAAVTLPPEGDPLGEVHIVGGASPPFQ
jgi:hypothetical protein